MTPKPITQWEHDLRLWARFLIQVLKSEGEEWFEKELRNYRYKVIRDHERTLRNKGLLKKEGS
jgi:hypothetical protein